MASENVLLMRKAKAQLSGQWGVAAVATIIYIAIMVAASSTYFVEFLVAGPMMLGYILYLIALVGQRQSNFDTLFKGFNRFTETLVAGLLVNLAALVGYALLIVPGIIVQLGFSLTFYIMADDPNISGLDAMKKSWEMMKGHKWEYFCLLLRFFGWLLLGIITLGIAMFWIQPYITVTTLNYYRKLRYGTF